LAVLLPGGAIRSERRGAGNRGHVLAEQVDLETRLGLDEVSRQVGQRNRAPDAMPVAARRHVPGDFAVGAHRFAP